MGRQALLEKEQEGDCPALPEQLAQPLSLTHSQRTPSPSPALGRLEGMGGEDRGGLRIGTAQVWGLRLRSSPGWLAPCLGLLEGDRQRVVGSPVTLDIGAPQDSGLVPCLASTLRAFALGDPICSQGCNYTQHQKSLLFIRELRLDLPDSPVISTPNTGPKPVPPPIPPPHTATWIPCSCSPPQSTRT